jgi:hypothetical protein
LWVFRFQTGLEGGYRMFKRIEFTLNMEDPNEAELYQALRPSLRGRRVGGVIRQALTLLYAQQLAANEASTNQPQIARGGKDGEA